MVNVDLFIAFKKANPLTTINHYYKPLLDIISFNFTSNETVICNALRCHCIGIPNHYCNYH